MVEAGFGPWVLCLPPVYVSPSCIWAESSTPWMTEYKGRAGFQPGMQEIDSPPVLSPRTRVVGNLNCPVQRPHTLAFSAVPGALDFLQQRSSRRLLQAVPRVFLMSGRHPLLGIRRTLVLLSPPVALPSGPPDLPTSPFMSLYLFLSICIGFWEISLDESFYLFIYVSLSLLLWSTY